MTPVQRELARRKGDLAREIARLKPHEDNPRIAAHLDSLRGVFLELHYALEGGAPPPPAPGQFGLLPSPTLELRVGSSLFKDEGTVLEMARGPYAALLGAVRWYRTADGAGLCAAYDGVRRVPFGVIRRGTVLVGSCSRNQSSS